MWRAKLGLSCGTVAFVGVNRALFCFDSALLLDVYVPKWDRG